LTEVSHKQKTLDISAARTRESTLRRSFI